MAQAQRSWAKQGEKAFERVEKINAELFTLTYGSLVTQLLKDNKDDAEAVNKALDGIGYSMGIRLVDEFLAATSLGACRTFAETAEVIAKVGFKMFLGVTAAVVNIGDDGQSFSLVLEENPLNAFVELPEKFKSVLWFSNVLCGVLRGALEMVMYRTECSFVKCVLRGDDTTEIRVQLLEILNENFVSGDDD
jgi:hypothetical protein|eukprot:CAMPEP_0174318836 /NCGR_PEP_ID=MMETSP0810-20121108/8467_1 /TAXON_ID=73025 ORGANISM="Eutreptiella gymnastica-like, Strain CCMP1594" /NCGR_SAMPLE_ID=MMETSP0810 /ASSEMBLY_ACC=CAM_ASM_000659 /LENGTH=191 /DNA_ID=CAMNT_0015429185 /DNA_START=29 /DNA_END=604 /DNA_ORIENTATION=+